MPTLAFDTNAAVKKLEKGGLTRLQADALAFAPASLSAAFPS
jgi:hypothetical protein